LGRLPDLHGLTMARRGLGRYPSAKKTVVDGITFHSKREAKRYQELKFLEAAGAIKGLELQPVFTLYAGDEPLLLRSPRYPNGRKLKYIADFRYYDLARHCIVIEDAKGHRTDVYKIKKALMEVMGFLVDEV
jgi:hypothetical protein